MCFLILLITFDEITFDEITFDEITFDEITFDEAYLYHLCKTKNLWVHK